MEPIISPVFIYLIGISSNVQWLLNLLVGLSAAFVLVAAAIYLASATDVYSNEASIHNTMSKCVKVGKYGLLCFVITGILGALIPSKQVATAMLVSSYITPDNLHGANEVIKANLQDYINIIVDGINKVK